MRRTLLIALLLWQGLSLAYTQITRQTGVNLADLSAFGTQWSTKNAMKHATDWMARSADMEGWTVWGQSVPLDSLGYPTHAPYVIGEDTLVPHCMVLSNQPAPWRYPAGDYILMFEGEGEVIVDWDVDGGSRTYTHPDSAHIVPITNPDQWGLNITISRSDTNNPIHNLRLYFPNMDTTDLSDPFLPEFKTLLSPFPVLRFMKPCGVEENTIEQWRDRTLPDNFKYSSDETGIIRDGMPYELVIQLCNDLDKSPWINIPHRVDDQYITELATLLRDSLDPQLDVYIEYANESWNPDYPVTRGHMETMGIDSGWGPDAGIAGQRYFVHRSMDIFDRFESVFGADSARIIGVMGAQADWWNGYLITTALKHPEVNPDGSIPDAIAIAPYFGLEVINNILEQEIQCSLDTTDILDSVDLNLEAWMDVMVQPFADWTDSLGIDLMAYEAGQHITTMSFLENDACTEDLVVETNRTATLGDYYCRYFEYWFDSLGGDLMMSFVTAESYNSYGAFGILESIWQDTATSAKWRAHINCTNLPAGSSKRKPDPGHSKALSPAMSLYPNPARDAVTVQFETTDWGPTEIALYDLNGRKVRIETHSQLEPGQHRLQLNTTGLQPGLYLLSLKNGNQSQSKKLLLH